MNGYITKLYIIEGDMDGEEVATGPYATEEEAQGEADKLMARGEARVVRLYENADVALLVIP